MNQSEKRNGNDPKTSLSSGSEISQSLIADLGSKNQTIRTKARKSILALGESAVGLLVEALSSPNKRLRWEANRLLDEMNVAWRKHADAKTISALIRDLGSEDGMVRVRARLALVTIGKRAVEALGKALTSKDDSKRWEVSKALGQIGDPGAVGILIRALEDKVFDVRWLAAEGLIKIGRPAIAPLLRAYIEKPDSLWLQEGVHHVLHDIINERLRGIVRPVLNALEDIEAELEAPLAAEKALNLLAELTS